MTSEMSISRVQRADIRDTVRADEVAVDRTPVTNARYAVFVDATGHRRPAYWPDGECPHSLDNHPVVGVDYFDAVAFARWAKGRLPTELEWVLASGLEEQRAFAWGDDFDTNRCNTFRSGHKGTTPVDAYPDGVAVSGCLDLCGNVWEMTASADKDHLHTVIVKGGSWYDYPAHAKLDASFHAPTHRVGRTVGFRLVYGGDERHPDFMDGDLLEACIDYRAHEQEKGSELDAPIEEFDFGALRDELELEHGANLVSLPQMDESIALDTNGVDTVLAWFDDADHAAIAQAESDKGNDNADANDWYFALYERVHSFLSAHALVLPTTLVSALGITLAMAVTVALPALGPSRQEAIAAFKPELDRAAVPAQPQRLRRIAVTARSTPNDLLAALASDDPQVRFRAEKVLLDRPTLPIERMETMLADDSIGLGARTSLRYVLAAAREKTLRLPDAVEIYYLPKFGLALAFSRVDGALADDILLARRAAQSVSLPLTVVYTGSQSPDAILSSFAPLLRGTEFFADPGALEAGRWAASKFPVFGVLGLGRTNGKRSLRPVRRPFRRESIADFAESVAELSPN